ncbi:MULTISPECIES: LLM class flavin-dependent oxidoreductase [unclassified Paenibacillus]|uniref:LLM class flavin-dependent oxidoreductase n=1 Tax=unclassified Paenibacillus TaxID=185978 RepID=UPI001AE8BAE3|nr:MULTISPECIES: LLM class flavin-dependent oxidoreductase [unclassified Paenibacillus]MBP1154228.1 FMNH2-dependent dimethyl sulfone monooxygenase [Paenibacillus sp. PvP091]MBP1170387.1 FMNH2-dependent dimethyl sulfone monooxygenase [Paenibacillus sp. PvR098]MBP2441415.1 FMNH2-dependent dimethyl sulfone monooxygenase [Paenibacillus sp. PvP052]
MKLGVWTPLPHTIRPEPIMEEAIDRLRNQGGEGETDLSYQYALDTVLKAEEYDFDITLIAERFLGPDLESWVLTSALAARTTSIELMAAVHPGIIHPQVVAKMGAAIDRISGGRFAVNIVNGWWKDEFNLFGNGAWLEDPEKRYLRMNEFVQVLKGLWSEDKYSFQGEFYRVESASLPTKTCRRPYPPIYAASRSETGKEIIANHCDVWFLSCDPGHRQFGDNVKAMAAEIDRMNGRGRILGREMGYGLSAHVICAASQDEAETRADELEAYRKNGGVSAIAAKALGAGLVGTPELIATRIKQYEELGIGCLMMHFHPMLEGLETFAREVMPMLRHTVRK